MREYFRLLLRLMARATILAIVATIRGAYWNLEQPWSSTARFFPPLVHAVSNIDKYILPCRSRLFLWLDSIYHNYYISEDSIES